MCAGTSIGGDNLPVCYELSAGWHVGGLGKWGQWTHARGLTVDVDEVLSIWTNRAWLVLAGNWGKVGPSCVVD